MSELSKISFAKAQSILKKFRYKPRPEWSDDERILFKLCNFAVLSKKRLNVILKSLQSLSKLSDKSHYKYNELDIKLIKELILDNLEVCFDKFKQKISVIKESDIEIIQNHINNIKNENLRLENEIKRLNFIIENYINEKELNEIKDIKDLLNEKVVVQNTKIRSSKKSKEKLAFDKRNIREFLRKWNEGQTTFEITESHKRIDVDIKNTKKRRFKL
ncbi:MAG: hypothetical protein CBC25_05280 [Pelagibacteraceae bacterium TMED65]|nr:hypothetical protein [Rickettsiales bacterium]OUU51474.1 MAG: hypothetical protein CBC25_05280 [Pelagibacteraceae bacterium TMED65]